MFMTKHKEILRKFSEEFRSALELRYEIEKKLGDRVKFHCTKDGIESLRVIMEGLLYHYDGLVKSDFYGKLKQVDEFITEMWSNLEDLKCHLIWGAEHGNVLDTKEEVGKFIREIYTLKQALEFILFGIGYREKLKKIPALRAWQDKIDSYGCHLYLRCHDMI